MLEEAAKHAQRTARKLQYNPDVKEKLKQHPELLEEFIEILHPKKLHEALKTIFDGIIGPAWTRWNPANQRQICHFRYGLDGVAGLALYTSTTPVRPYQTAPSVHHRFQCTSP